MTAFLHAVDREHRRGAVGPGDVDCVARTQILEVVDDRGPGVVVDVPEGDRRAPRPGRDGPVVPAARLWLPSGGTWTVPPALRSRHATGAVTPSEGITIVTGAATGSGAATAAIKTRPAMRIVRAPMPGTGIPAPVLPARHWAIFLADGVHVLLTLRCRRHRVSRTSPPPAAMTAHPAADASPLAPGPVPPPVAGVPAGKPVLVAPEVPVAAPVGKGLAVPAGLPVPVAVPVGALVAEPVGPGRRSTKGRPSPGRRLWQSPWRWAWRLPLQCG